VASPPSNSINSSEKPRSAHGFFVLVPCTCGQHTNVRPEDRFQRGHCPTCAAFVTKKRPHAVGSDHGRVIVGAGYATALFRKWHLGSHDGRLPNNQGFDEWYGIPRTTDEAHAWSGSVPRRDTSAMRGWVSLLIKWDGQPGSSICNQPFTRGHCSGCGPHARSTQRLRGIALPCGFSAT
jgi:hypothetical protein